MRRLAACAITAFTISLAPLAAQPADEAKVDALFTALGMPQMLEIMREEGMDYGQTIGAEMLPGGGSTQWLDAVSAIYDPQMMFEEVQGAFVEALDGDDVDAMLDFYTSDLGVKIVGLEVSARRALLDDAVEEASIEASALQILDETPRYLVVKDFIEASDLIEQNVVGALNSSYAFYIGLIDGGVMPAGVTPESALQEVWSQEQDIREETTEWLYSFLLMAYQPLSDEEMQSYLAFTETEAGQDMTNALFVAFDGMFDDISRALGLASSRFMVTQEL